MNTSVDICIVGAGAAGLAAALFAAEERSGLAIHVLDGARSIGAKILVSGGGRCNVTHATVCPEDFHGNRHIIRNVLSAFGVEATRRWFASLGVQLKVEPTGKLFPVTDKARTVLDALTGRCRELGILIRPGHRVREIAGPGPFRIRHDQGDLQATRVVLATGGRSLPKTGSDGFGYELARAFGHDVTATVPALVPLHLAPSMFHASLSGLSLDAEITTRADSRPLDRRTGSMLWTHFGVSGPAVMDASRFWTLAHHRGEPVALQANFLPGRTDHDIRQWLMAQSRDRPGRSLTKTVGQLLPERLGAELCRYAGCDPQAAVGQLPRAGRARLTAALTAFHLPVERDRGWNFAEVTAGGVPLEEMNFRTMESRRMPGLYLIGEILDCDGRIGGFNFQWAWATGYVAGRAAARREQVPPP